MVEEHREGDNSLSGKGRGSPVTAVDARATMGQPLLLRFRESRHNLILHRQSSSRLTTYVLYNTADVQYSMKPRCMQWHVQNCKLNPLAPCQGNRRRRSTSSLVCLSFQHSGLPKSSTDRTWLTSNLGLQMLSRNPLIIR